MSYSVDRATKVISIPKADLTLISGTLYELDTEVFRNELHTIQASEEGMVYDDMFYRNAPYAVAGITYAQSIQIINGYSITFENGAYSVRLIGSNNDIFDIEAGILNQNTVQVIPNNSAGLVDLNKIDIEHGAYNESVMLHAGGGSGTTHPWGTSRQPVNNLADAKTIATNRGFNQLCLCSDFTLEAAGNVDGYRLITGKHEAVTLTVTAGCSTIDTLFRDIKLTGTLGGTSHILNCNIPVAGLLGVEGEMERVTFRGDITTANNATLDILNCWSAIPGHSHPNVTCVGTVNMGVRAWTGGFGVKGFTAGNISIDLISGHAKLYNTCTGGIAVLRGTGKKTDESNGTDVDSSHLIQGVHVQDLHDEAFGKWVLDPAGKTMTLYKADGVTILKTFNLTDTSASILPFISRTPV
ncbi:hypothetical protein KAR91_51990 [Candidatus Pacearchaeota archaeon]|nr:hypothetical protein [Candidatus Pacearchaeota archaeon]